MSNYVEDTTLTFKPSELLLLTDALRLLINNPEKHPLDKQGAERIIERIYESVNEYGT